MENVQASQREIRILPITGGVRIEIPALRRWWQAFGIAICLSAWTAGIMSALGDGGDRLGRQPAADLAFFGLFGLGLLAFGVVSLLWAVAGREVLEVDARHVRVGTEVPILGRNLGRTRVYDRAAVRNLRFEPEAQAAAPRSRRSSHGGKRRDRARNLCFDAGKETVRFGQSVTAPEAARILSAVNARFPIPRA